MKLFGLQGIRRLASVLLLLSLGATAVAAAERGPRASTAAPALADAQVIVKFKADSTEAQILSSSTAAANTGPQRAQNLSTRLGLSLSDGHAMGPRTQVIRGTGLSSQDLADQLSAQSDVEYAVVDGRKRALIAAPNDPLFLNAADTQTPAAGQWYLQAPSTTLVSAINAQAAWAVTTGKSTLVVADIDTGVRFDHPDLTSKLLAGYDFITNVAQGNSGLGRNGDASDPGDWVTSAENASGQFANCGASNSSWHGTETAGVIGAATNNDLGMASIGYSVMVMPLRVLGKCGGVDSDIIDAMRWAAGLAVSGVPANPHPASVINMSLGSSGTCSAAYQDAVAQVLAANVSIVIAVGNDGLTVGTPANCSGVIAVAGVRQAGTKVGYSDLGSAVTLSAPAGNCVDTTGATCIYPILTTSNSGTTTPVAGAAGATYTSGGADASLGTSFAAPLVTGTVALMVSANAALTPAQVTSALKSSARAFPTTGGTAGSAVCAAPSSIAQSTECYCSTSTCGAGLLDAGKAVSMVAVANANISVASTNAAAGTAVTLDGSGSSPSVGATISSYQWAITSGSSIASFTSSTTASTATLLPTAAGSVTVSLTVTDSNGVSDTNSTTLTVAAAATTAPVTTGSTGSTSSGGGGAMGALELLAWLAAIGAVRVVTPRDKRRGS